jgi:mannose-6-phosphate isomerase-like protein (cupin superfamily)
LTWEEILMIGRIAWKGGAVSAGVLLLSTLGVVSSQLPPAGYVYKPLRPTGWTAPMRPFTRLADLKAQHKGEKEWSEWVVKDEHLWSQYIQSAPGSKVSPRFHPDTREWWVILEGQIRFDIEGQQPFTARRRSMVQVPPQTIYSMETVGNVPAIRVETNIQNAVTIYVQPPNLTLPGFELVPVTTARRPFPYGKTNKPHINLDDLAADPGYEGSRFVDDDRAVSNIIFTRDPSKLPPVMEHDTSHWHAGGAEYWVVLIGQIRFPLEGQEIFILNEGDLAYAPAFTRHEPRGWGDGPACRLAMDGVTSLTSGGRDGKHAR